MTKIGCLLVEGFNHDSKIISLYAKMFIEEKIKGTKSCAKYKI